MKISEQDLHKLKEKMLETEVYQKSYRGVYFPAIHGMDLNIQNKSYPQVVIAYIHESMHYIEQNGLFGILLHDYMIMFLTLAMYYEEYKAELLKKFLGVKDICNSKEYLFTHTEEINKYLSKDCCLVKFISFCLEIYDIYHFLIINSKLINESIASYISLHINSTFNLYKTLKLEDFFYNLSVSEEIYTEQKLEIKQLLDLDDENIYKIGYLHTKKLIEQYGLETVLTFNDIIINFIPFYNFDLLTSDITKRKNILNKYYNADRKWLNLENLNPNELIKMYNGLPESQESLARYICGFCCLDFPEIEGFKHTWDYSVKYLWRNDCVKEAIALLKGPQDPIIAEFEFLQQLSLAKKIETSQVNPILEITTERSPIFVSDKRILNFPELTARPNLSASNLLIKKIYLTMKDIMICAEEKNS